jgi:hypothetical protein
MKLVPLSHTESSNCPAFWIIREQQYHTRQLRADVLYCVRALYVNDFLLAEFTAESNLVSALSHPSFTTPQLLEAA